MVTVRPLVSPLLRQPGRLPADHSPPRARHVPRRPEREAYEQGRPDSFWAPLRALWAEPGAANREPRTIRVGGISDAALGRPDIAETACGVGNARTPRSATVYSTPAASSNGCPAGPVISRPPVMTLTALGVGRPFRYRGRTDHGATDRSPCRRGHGRPAAADPHRASAGLPVRRLGHGGGGRPGGQTLPSWIRGASSGRGGASTGPGMSGRPRWDCGWLSRRVRSSAATGIRRTGRW